MSQTRWSPKLIFFSLFLSWRKVSESCQRCFVKKLFWRIFAKISGKESVIESFISKVRGSKPATFTNKTFHRTCFHGTLAKCWEPDSIKRTCTAASVSMAGTYITTVGSSWFSFCRTSDKVKELEGQIISLMS